MNDYDFARLLYLRAELAGNPAMQAVLNELEVSKDHKSEWGRTLSEYIHDIVTPDYGPLVLDKSHVQADIDLVQLREHSAPGPTCETFRSILKLVRDPIKLPMLNNTTLLPSCVCLLRKHVEDTQKPVKLSDQILPFWILKRGTCRCFIMNMDTSVSSSWS